MSNNHSADNKRIAKNTLMLYFRMLITMGVGLYTSRITLSALGVEDYGVYNVVGGFVGMFTIISGSLSAAIGRFITFHLGKGDQQRLNTVFSTSLIIQFVLAAIIVILVESVGVWFLTHKLVIPEGRMYAAHWVLQLSLLTLAVNMVSMPYNAAIIAHEKMSAFAYISLLDVFWKLLVAFLLTRSGYDRLIFFASLLCGISLFMRLIYGIYCRVKFEECHNIKLVFDRALFKEMFGFSGWNFIGTISWILKGQGVDIIINILAGGPAVNAAKGIAAQVNNAVCGFSGNFMTALNPQITKSYASEDRAYMMTLIHQGARLSFYLILTLSLPVLVSTYYVLSLWLGIVPEYTVVFVRLSLVAAMCEALSNPLITAALATGNIKRYQIIVGGVHLLHLPLSYLMLKLGFSAPIVYVVTIFLSMVCLAARLYMLRGMIGLSAKSFLSNVFFNVLVVSALSAILPILVRFNVSDDFFGFVLVSAVSVISTLMVIYFIGCNNKERIFVDEKVSKFAGKVFNR